MNVTIEESWKRVLSSEFEKEYFKTLRDFIHSEYRNKIIYPPAKQIFNAFDSCPFESVKVVILGQDPYHEPSQAHGLSFSVLPPCPPPPSLVNIYKEIRSDVGTLVSANGDLTAWSRQGVLLLNATLTVEAHKAGSHQNKGWETFTEGYTAKVSKACIKMSLQYALGRKCFNPTQTQLRKAKDKLKNTFAELRHRGEFRNLPLWMQPTIEIGKLHLYVRILDLNA